jgi:hypothetical protein
VPVEVADVRLAELVLERSKRGLRRQAPPTLATISSSRARRGLLTASPASRASIALSPSNAPARSSGPTPAMHAAPSSRSGSRCAHASAYAPPPEYPTTPNRPTPSASASSATSSAHDRIVRPGSGSDRPIPGRSGHITVMPLAIAGPCTNSMPSRLAGVPWNTNTTGPSGTPCVVSATRRPFGNRTWKSRTGPAAIPAPSHVADATGQLPSVTPEPNTKHPPDPRL